MAKLPQLVQYSLSTTSTKENVVLSHLKSRGVALGGVVSAMALATVLSAPAAQASTPTSTPAATAAVTTVAFVADRRGDHRGDRCWRFWGGRWHFVCQSHRGHPIFHGPIRHHRPVFHGPIHHGGPVHKDNRH